MARALVITTEVEAAIKALIAKAAENVTPMEQVERAAAFHAKNGVGFNAYNEAMTIDIPVGFAATFTHEEQKGRVVCRHLSISVDGRGGPHPLAVAAIMEAFGFKNKFGRAPAWIERLPSGGIAVNVVEPLDGDLSKLQRQA